jgi:spermidine synthase
LDAQVVKPLLWLCFTLSGAAALALELLWVRSASLVAGATATTAATVLASYFAGLGLGATFARRGTAYPVRRYGALELAAAGLALASYGVFAASASEPGQRVLEAGGWLARTLVVSLAVLPATVAFGATLPTLAPALAIPSNVGSRGGVLYSLNTLGGAGGIAAMGFGLPPAIGVWTSYLAAAATSAIAGSLALWVGDDELPPRAATTARPSALRLRAAAFVTGFLAIGLEVLWIRLFAQVLHNSVYSFAAVSIVVLLAIALGAALGAAFLRRIAPERVAAGALLSAGIATVCGLWSFVYWTGGLAYFGMRTGLLEYVLRIILLAAATAGPAALASGAVLPALWAASGNPESVSRPIGEITSANLFGAVLGALGTAFLGIPLVGVRTLFLLAAVTYVALADAAIGAGIALRGLVYVVLLFIATFDPVRAPLAHLGPGESLRAILEGPSGVVTVVDTGDDMQLRLDNYYVLGGTAAERGERRQGLIPLLLHSAPRRVAFVGLATGISASAATALGIPDVTVIELVPEVTKVARNYFAPWNAHVLDARGVALVIDDGRRYLTATSSRFDVVVSDLFIPWHAGAGSLYTREMYAAVSRRLGPGGIFCQWLPLYQLTREEFDVIARTFLAVFPNVTLWRNDFYPDRPVIGLVGSADPLTVDLDSVGARIGALPEWARDSLLSSGRSLAMVYLGNLSLAPDVAGRGVLNTDDRPLIEFLAPRLTRMSALGDKDWFTGESLDAFAEAMASHPAMESDKTLPPTESVADARNAGAALYRYAIAAGRGDREAATLFEREVGRLVPEIVAAGDTEAQVAALADVRRNLVDLKAEQDRLRRQVQEMEARLEERGMTTP